MYGYLKADVYAVSKFPTPNAKITSTLITTRISLVLRRMPISPARCLRLAIAAVRLLLLLRRRLLRRRCTPIPIAHFGVAWARSGIPVPVAATPTTTISTSRVSLRTPSSPLRLLLLLAVAVRLLLLLLLL